MIQKKRTIFYLTPHDGYFDLSFVFGDKAVAAAEKSSLPKKLLEEHASPTEEQVRDFLKGNLCRCTGYASIVRAVMDGAKVESASG